MADPVRVCALSDLREGEPKALMSGGRNLALVRVADTVHAFDGICPHRGASLGEGFLNDGCLVCPWHGWQFDLQTGMYAPGSGVTKFVTEVRDGAVWVAL